jgi:hypothetical protein
MVNYSKRSLCNLLLLYSLDKQLRDRKFTILADHKNLTFIKQSSNPMVVRWHLALQELDFTLEYVKGVENTIADAMSRLCINNTPPKIETAIMSAIQGTYVLSNEADNDCLDH